MELNSGPLAGGTTCPRCSGKGYIYYRDRFGILVEALCDLCGGDEVVNPETLALYLAYDWDVCYDMPF